MIAIVPLCIPVYEDTSPEGPPPNAAPLTELEEAKEEFKKRGPKAYKQYFMDRLEAWKKIPMDIAIIGECTQGKSTLISSIQHLTTDDDIEEQTPLEPRAYAHPKNENFKFWMLPQLNTGGYTKENYFDKIDVHAYDFFLLICTKCFTDDDKWLAEQIKKRYQKVFFVRANVHHDVQQDLSKHPEFTDGHYQADKVLEDITNETLEVLGPCERCQDFFLIDSHAYNMYDYCSLLERLIAEFPVDKREALLRSVIACNKRLLDQKKEVLKKDAYYAAIGAAVTAAVPLPGLAIAADLILIVSISITWYHELSLDEDSLKRIAKVTNTEIELLKQIVHDGNVAIFLSVEALKGFLIYRPVVWFQWAAEEFTRYIPFLGPLVASGISAWNMYDILVYVLEMMYKTALNVVEAAWGAETTDWEIVCPGDSESVM